MICLGGDELSGIEGVVQALRANLDLGRLLTAELDRVLDQILKDLRQRGSGSEDDGKFALRDLRTGFA